MGQKITNNARALLVGSISALDTSLTVEVAKADSFPVGNTANHLAPVDWFKSTIEDSSGNIETVYVGTRTAGSGVLSVLLRGQEGTTARAFAAGAVVELRITALDVQNAIAGQYPNVGVTNKITQGGVDGRVTPVGGIIMYSGAVVDIPTGWQLCDGTNGTPNLRDKFVIGAGTGYAVGATGGSKDATLVTHDHVSTFTGTAMAAHGHGTTEAAHSHSIDFVSSDSSGSGGPGLTAAAGNDPRNVSPSTTGLTVNAASAGTPAGSVSVSTVGASATDANLPPYYALAFIRCMEFV